MQNIGRKMVFMTVDIKQESDPWEMGNKRGEPMTAPSSCLK